MRIFESITSPFRQGGHAIWKWVKCQLASVNETPIFVLGNQKSGTTAIAILLAKRADLSVEWDLTTIEHGSLINKIHRGEASIGRLIGQNRLIFSTQVIKDPNITFCFNEVKERFPRAKFIMVVRHPCDNIRSILDRLGIPGNKSNIHYSRYDKIPNGWEVMLKGEWMDREGGDYIKNLALRWKKAASTYIDNINNIEVIKYENFCIDKVASIDDLSSRLGIERKKSIEDEVDKQFQPKGENKNSSWEKFFGRKNISKIKNTCGEEAEKLGYMW